MSQLFSREKENKSQVALKNRKILDELLTNGIKTLSKEERFLYVNLVASICINLCSRRHIDLSKHHKKFTWVRFRSDEKEYVKAKEQEEADEHTEEDVNLEEKNQFPLNSEKEDVKAAEVLYFKTDEEIYLEFLQNLCVRVELPGAETESVIKIYSTTLREALKDPESCVTLPSENYIAALLDSYLNNFDLPDKSSSLQDEQEKVSKKTSEDQVNKDFPTEATKPEEETISDKKEGPADNENITFIFWILMQDLLITAISLGVYDSRYRALYRKMVSLFRPHLNWFNALAFESQLGVFILERDSKQDDVLVQAQKEEREKLQERGKIKKYALIGAAAVGGGVLIGVTGGLAAPLVAAGAGVILGASAGTFLATAGGVALTTTLFAGAGMGLAGSAMSNRVADLQEFEFKCVAKNPGSLSVLVSVSGWISEDYDFEDQWGSLDDFSERYVIIWEREDLRNVTKSIKDIAVNMGTTFVAKRIIAQTSLAALLAAVALPMSLMDLKLAIDNPWSRAMSRAKKAGAVLADALVERKYGQRPVNLIGHSFGARAIFFALLDLASRKKPFRGIIENVYLMAAPVPIDPSTWFKACSVVAGTITNCYHPNDMVLGLFYRVTSISMDVAGISPIDLPQSLVENVDVSDVVNGHTDYPDKMDHVLYKIGVLKEKPPSVNTEETKETLFEKCQQESNEKALPQESAEINPKVSEEVAKNQ
ncbi:transmembrane and coiled-coil domain-containing protein 4-like [Zophobas morio]|uniref:transmembrane and coiled-coil domain-containing protein 4-like n=1 Tax=Zophobas morio TaxID=2755281 RepID=UPI0030836CF9